MSFSAQKADRRELAYGRIVAAVLGTLREAVERRVDEGESRAALGAKIGMDKSQLSRNLNGRVSNLTLRTISDILFAAGHDPLPFSADAWEDISPNQWDKYGPIEDGKRSAFSETLPLQGIEMSISQRATSTRTNIAKPVDSSTIVQPVFGMV